MRPAVHHESMPDLVLPQHQCVETDRHDPGDRTHWWRARRHHGLDGLTASFRRHRYAPHSHDTYVIGVIVSGCEVYNLRGERRVAAAGSLNLIDPGEVHDGAPLDKGFSYRMTYPAPALLAELAGEVGLGHQAPHFPEPVVDDPVAAQAMLRAHCALEQGNDPLAADEALLQAMALILRRHGERGACEAAAPARSTTAVARVRDYLESCFAGSPDLAELAAVAGLSRHHLLRLFKRETGLTPHAYLTDCRVRAARRLLCEGMPPSQVALSCGFFDQSHLNRAFKQRIGSAPGAYRAA